MRKTLRVEMAINQSMWNIVEVKWSESDKVVGCWCNAATVEGLLAGCGIQLETIVWFIVWFLEHPCSRRLYRNNYLHQPPLVKLDIPKKRKKKKRGRERKKKQEPHRDPNHPHLCCWQRPKFFCPVVNVDKLWSLVSKNEKEKASKDNAPFIDVTQFSYFKVLENGLLSEKLPIVVKAKLIAITAEKKSRQLVVLLFTLLGM
jgi:hypothetical protein